MEVKALTAHRYGGKLYKPGEKYEIKGASDLRLYKALKRVEESTSAPASAPAPVRTTYTTASMRAEAPAPAAKKVAAKRAYNRRDMTAEE